MTYLAIALMAGMTIFFLSRWLNQKGTSVALDDQFILSAHMQNDRRVTDIVAGAVICVAVMYVISGRILFSLPFAVGGLAWSAYQERKRKKDIQKKLQDQFLQVLSTLAATMQGGINPYQALSDAAPSLQSPSREIFLEALRRQRLGGQALEEILEQMAEETKWEDLKALAMVYGLYTGTGANLVEVIRHLSDTIYERKSDMKYTEAVTAQVRATSLILSAIPFVLIAAIRFASPSMIEPMFSTFGGIVVFCMIIGMVITGNIVINRMVAKALG